MFAGIHFALKSRTNYKKREIRLIDYNVILLQFKLKTYIVYLPELCADLLFFWVMFKYNKYIIMYNHN